MLCQRILKSNFFQIYNFRIINDGNMIKNIEMNNFYLTGIQIILGIVRRVCYVSSDDQQFNGDK